MPRADAARDLLFGLLALQTGLIDQAKLVAAFHAWTLDKSSPLADYLVSQGALDADQRTLLDALVAQHLKKHDGDADKSLASLPVGPSTRESLAATDPEIEASLAHVGSGPSEPDGERTATYSVGTATSDGQRYHVLRPHARGGLGAVFVALDNELHREVALKQLLDHHADDATSRQRFLMEAEITGGLEHPGIVPVYGLGSYGDGRPFYAMRFIKGDSLKGAIERFHADGETKTDAGRRSLELRKLLRRFTDVCNAIDYAHSRGVLHRDIKPGNVIVGKHGETLVVDWGLAKAVHRSGETADDAERTLIPSSASGSAETLPGQTLGTPAYMSPEQARGDLDVLGPRSDVYSLGATLYCLLTGKAPFTGDAADVLRAVERGDFLPPRSLDPTLDPSLEAVCLKAMATTPGDRYASCRALAEDVERWAADEPVSAWREPLGLRARRWARRHRPLVAATAALLVTAVVALTVSTVLILREKDRTEERRREAVASSREAVEKAESLRRQLYVNRVNLAQREWSVGNLVQAERLLDDCPEDLRKWEWSYCKRLCHLELLDYRGHGIDVWSVAFSPDGNRVASGAGMFVYSDDEGRGELAVWNTATGQEVFSHRGLKSGVQGVAFSPDGAKVATAGALRRGRYQGELTLWDATTGRQLFVRPEPAVNALCVAFSPDCRRVGVGYGVFNSGSRDGPFGSYFKLYDAETGDELLKLPGRPGGITALAFHPDGQRIALASPGIIELWDLETRARRGELRGHSQWIYSAAFSPDGTKLATGGWDNAVRLWDMATSQEIRDFVGHSSFVRGVAFSPDGARILSGGEDRSVKLWDVATGRELVTFYGHAGFVHGLAFSPDGTRFASASMDGTVKVWDPDAGPYRALRGHKGWVSGVAFSPGNRWIASVEGWPGGNVLKLWDTATGRQVSEIPGNIGGYSGVTFSRDGDRLLAVSQDNAVRVWDAATGRELLSLRGHKRTIHGFSLSPDDHSVATASDDGTVRLWDAATGHQLRVFEGGTHGARSEMQISNALAFSPDGHLLALAASDKTVRLWDTATGALVRTLTGHTGLTQSVSFSPDGRLLASGDGFDIKYPGVIKIWDVRTGLEILSLRGHASRVYAVAFSPDGSRLASACDDKTIKLWDPVTGQEVFTLSGHNSGILCLSFSSDGHRIISGGMDWTARIWDGTPLPPERLSRSSVRVKTPSRTGAGPYP
jgi:WD40 repeat protein/serine/threonine protein kinase